MAVPWDGDGAGPPGTAGFAAGLCLVRQIRVGESLAVPSGRELGFGGSVLLPSHSFPKPVIFSSSVALGLGRGIPGKATLGMQEMGRY